MGVKDFVPSSSGLWEVSEIFQTGNTQELTQAFPNDLELNKLKIKDLIQMIPDYDGCPYLLGRFTEIVKLVASKICDRTLLLALATKLKGDANRVFQHKIHRYININEFLYSLYLCFSGRGSYTIFSQDLRNLKQLDHETVEEYAHRADRIHTLLYNIRQYNPVMSLEDRISGLETLEKEAIACFKRGLKDKELERCITAAEAVSLQQAMVVAIFAAQNERISSLGISEKYRTPLREVSNIKTNSEIPRRPYRFRDSDLSDPDSGLFD